MSENELSYEERTDLWNNSLFYLLVVSISLMIFVLFFEQYEVSLKGWGMFIWVGLPFSIIEPISAFLPYEVYFPKRLRKSPMFHLKRFLRRTLSMTAIVICFFGAGAYSDVTFSKTLGSDAYFPGWGLCLVVFFVIAILWLRSHQPKW
jgi:hypothetical protein